MTRRRSRVSVHLWTEDIAATGQARVDLLGGYRALGVSRVMGLIKASATDDEALPRVRRGCASRQCGALVTATRRGLGSSGPSTPR